MGIESSTITEDDYIDYLQELIDKLDEQIFYNNFDKEKENIKEKLNKYGIAQHFIKRILIKKKEKILLTK